ncbi:hypothetical protein ES703_82453 [subsurface metagenome]
MKLMCIFIIKAYPKSQLRIEHIKGFLSHQKNGGQARKNFSP